MSAGFKEKTMHAVFLFCAGASIAAVALICIFLFANGIPGLAKIGVFNFLTGREWRPVDSPPVFGILPMITGSLYVTAGAVVIGVPVGILTAVYMAAVCPKKIYVFAKPAAELLAGIPSIVYGFFGLMVIVPVIRNIFGGSGTSLLAASVLLGIMILPTVVGISESALRAVPDAYFEGALALGAGKMRAWYFVMLPAAKSGVFASVVLGIGAQ